MPNQTFDFVGHARKTSKGLGTRMTEALLWLVQYVDAPWSSCRQAAQSRCVMTKQHKRQCEAGILLIFGKTFFTVHTSRLSCHAHKILALLFLPVVFMYELFSVRTFIIEQSSESYVFFTYLFPRFNYTCTLRISTVWPSWWKGNRKNAKANDFQTRLNDFQTHLNPYSPFSSGRSQIVIVAHFHPKSLASFPRKPVPETIKLGMGGLFRARKNSCRTCHYEVKCRKALRLYAREARTQANPEFSCVRNTNCSFAHCAAIKYKIGNSSYSTDIVRHSSSWKWTSIRIFGGSRGHGLPEFCWLCLWRIDPIELVRMLLNWKTEQ